MNGETNFCGCCGNWLGPEQGEIRLTDDNRIEAVCETCLALEVAQAGACGNQQE